MIGSNAVRAEPARPIRIGFLFNHESVHQIAHSAPIIAELSRHHPAFEITVLASTAEQLEFARRLVSSDAASRLRYAKLEMSPLFRVLDRVANKVSPLQRVATLKRNLDALGRFDALVVPEMTSLMLKTKLGLDTRLIYTQHGAGDRSIGFSPSIRKFDFVLVSGRKVLDRMRRVGCIREGHYAVVGYPKFEAVDLEHRQRPRLFANDRPTVLYNPHFEPRLSSWYRMGRRVLDFFYDSPDYNLVFAPHVMLFKRRWHASLERFSVRFRAGVPDRFRDCAHILVDTGSEACVDMTYTLGADIYVGDVSSQIYEFIVEPRPCIFLNAHGADWKGDPSYLHWECGSVLTDPSALGAELQRATSDPQAYREVQERLTAYTFDRGEAPAARRGADAIAGFLLHREDAAAHPTASLGRQRGRRRPRRGRGIGGSTWSR